MNTKTLWSVIICTKKVLLIDTILDFFCHRFWNNHFCFDTLLDNLTQCSEVYCYD